MPAASPREPGSGMRGASPAFRAAQQQALAQPPPSGFHEGSVPGSARRRSGINEGASWADRERVPASSILEQRLPALGLPGAPQAQAPPPALGQAGVAGNLPARAAPLSARGEPRPGGGASSERGRSAGETAAELARMWREADEPRPLTPREAVPKAKGPCPRRNSGEPLDALDALIGSLFEQDAPGVSAPPPEKPASAAPAAPTPEPSREATVATPRSGRRASSAATAATPPGERPGPRVRDQPDAAPAVAPAGAQEASMRETARFGFGTDRIYVPLSPSLMSVHRPGSPKPRTPRPTPTPAVTFDTDMELDCSIICLAAPSPEPPPRRVRFELQGDGSSCEPVPPPREGGRRPRPRGVAMGGA